MNREQEQSRHRDVSLDADFDGAHPGKASASAKLSKSEHATPSGLVGTKDQDELNHATQLEREIVRVEDRYQELIAKISTKSLTNSEVLEVLKVLHREQIELRTRVANARRTKKLDERYLGPLEKRLDDLTYLEDRAQRLAHDKGLL